ncbi:MAG: EamA family transporter [Ilumatobacteraceae bacterium]
MTNNSPEGRVSARLLTATPPEVLFVTSASAQYAGAVIAVKLFDDLSPATVAWIRVLSAGLILGAFSLRQRHSSWTRRDIAWASAFGIATASMNMFFYLAINYLPLGKGVTIEFIGPIAVAALTTKSLRNTYALLLATLGVLILGGVEIGNEPLGLVFILLASTMWAAYIVIGSRVALGDHGVAGLAIGLVVGGVAITPFASTGANTAFTSPTLLLSCIAIGVLSNVIGYGIDQTTLRRIPIRRFSVMLALLPVTAAAFGFIFLGQTPSTIDLAGMALVLVGVAVQERDVVKRHQSEAQTA